MCAGGIYQPFFVQDYEPSADHFANMNTALTMMLLQDGGHGLDDNSSAIILLPAWPCSQDVSFKLWGPLATSVEVVYTNSTLQLLEVIPPSRRSAVRFANCVTDWQ